MSNLIYNSLSNGSNMCDTVRKLQAAFGGQVEFGTLKNNISLQLNGSAEPLVINREEDMFVITTNTGEQIGVTIPNGEFVPKPVNCNQNVGNHNYRVGTSALQHWRSQ